MAGRARGGRGGPPKQQPQQRPPQPPASQGAWGQRAAAGAAGPGAGSAAPAPTAGRSVRAPAPQAHGDQPGSARGAVPPAGEPTSGGGDAIGRGSMRGRRLVTAGTLRTRPDGLKSKQGSVGTRVQLCANYFRILTKTDWCLFQYRVDFAPEVDSAQMKKGLLRIHRERVGSYIFDGTVMYTSNRLSVDDTPIELFSCRQSDDENIRITIRMVGQIADGDPHYMQFYNILARKSLQSLQLQQVGRNYFDPEARIEIRDHQLHIWPGYLTSIRHLERDIMMCAEINHKVMRLMTLYDILKEIEDNITADLETAYKGEVIGMTCLTDYNNNTYRIDDVDFSASPADTFHLTKEDREISYMEYYRVRYNIQIQDPKQPMLVTRSNAKERRAGDTELVYLVPELCRATGITDEMRANFRLMKALADHTRLTPERRIERLMNFNRRLQENNTVQAEYKNWNMKLDTQLAQVPGRILPNEKLVFGGNMMISAGPNGDWMTKMKDVQLMVPKPLTKWLVIMPERLERDVTNYLRDMSGCISNFSMSKPVFRKVRYDRAENYTQVIDDELSRTNYQLVMCILFKNRIDTYAAIKKKCCLDRPVPSQIVTQRCFTKNAMSIATKIAIQLNCKIGGVPWTVEKLTAGLMVVGYDVCHDTQRRGTDFGAMVASSDAKFSKFFSAVAAHTTGEELSNHLAIHMAAACRKWLEVNGTLPSYIVMFRDGVGDGQIPFVVDHEVQHVRSAMAKLYPDGQPPRMAYIVVNKRINTRLFQNNRNPLPGTIVDDVITNPEKYDYFLISQSVKQGTVSPTSYSVIHDTTCVAPDKLQGFTFKMTHLYFNCSNTMQVPAPVHFAHKLAFLVSQSVHAPPTSPILSESLYFL